MVERNQLPGNPSNRLIREVRVILYRYLFARPERNSKLWRDTWEWAYKLADFKPWLKRRRLSWPQPNEIATQYVYLALMEMRTYYQLRLPYRAQQQELATPAVLARMAECAQREKAALAWRTPESTTPLLGLAEEAAAPLLTLLEDGRNKL